MKQPEHTNKYKKMNSSTSRQAQTKKESINYLACERHHIDFEIKKTKTKKDTSDPASHHTLSYMHLNAKIKKVEMKSTQA